MNKTNFPHCIAFFWGVLLLGSAPLESLAQPINDDCSGIIHLGEGYICPSPEIYNNIDATPSNVFTNPSDNIPSCFMGGTVERDVWFSFQVPADGSILDYEILISGVNTSNGSITNPQFAVYRGDCSQDQLAELVCVSADAGETEIEAELLGLTPGITYFIRVDDWSDSASSNAGDFEICIRDPEEGSSPPEDLPWDLDPTCGTIVTNGIAAVSCGVSISIPENDRWVFGLMNFNDVMPAFGRIDVSNEVEVYHHPSWHVDSIGNVFGITMDNQGNIYTTASSNYGTTYFNEIGVIRYGEIGGGAEDIEAAGTIYKIDGVSGQASVFAVLPQQLAFFNQGACEFPLDMSRNTGPGLGNITFNYLAKQFYVSNFEDGRIYRLDLEGNILDSYDPLGLDNGMAGEVSLPEMAYGLDIRPDGTALFFGNTSESTFGTGDADIYSINLNPDGSFTGTINNSSLPSGATWDNYVGNETLHYEIEVTSFSFPEQLAISDMEFTPEGKLLVGCRSVCSSNIHSSYNHGGRTVLLSQNGGGIFNQEEGIIYTGYPFSLGGSNESYGGVSAFQTENGQLLYAISSADMLEEEGPHGISLSEDGDFGGPGNPVSPAGIISYGSDPITQDPKGIGGDVKLFVTCSEELSCSLDDIDAGEDLIICAPGQTVELDGIVFGDYTNVEWTPSEGLSNPNSLNPSVEVSTTTTFTMKAYGVGTNQNLIVNGSFNFGETGFTSDYTLGDGGPFGQLSSEGEYAITPNSSLVHINWFSCTDHTGGGNMLAVNGATTPGENVWCQTIAIEADTDYEFSTWSMSTIPENPAILQFSINGTLLGSPFNVAAEACQWNQFFETWNSTTNTTAEICIANQNTSPGGNDFAIDDISFGPVCTAEDEVTVSVVDLVAEVVPTALIPCDNSGVGITLDGTGSSTGPDISYEWTTPDGNIVSGANTLIPTVDAAGTYTLTVAQISNIDTCIATAAVIVDQDTTTLTLPETIELCQGDSYTFDVSGFDTYQWSPSDSLSCDDCPDPTAIPSTTTTYTLVATTLDGCMASASTEIIVLPTFETTLEFDACESDTVDYNGTGLLPGSATDFTFTTQNGCDSVVTVIVNTLEEFATSVTLTACESETVEYNGTDLAPGSVADFTFMAQNGCDSVVTVTVETLQEFTSSLTLAACESETVEYNGSDLAPGSVTDFTFMAQNGCDSVVTVTVETLQEFTSSLTLAACESETVEYNGSDLAPGSVTDFTFTAQNGCDSVVTVTVETLQEFTSSLTLEACESETVEYNGTDLAPGSVADFTFMAQNGCDSVVTVTVETLQEFTSSLTLAACESETVEYNGSDLAPGSVTDFTFTAQNGCDSVVTVTVETLLHTETSENIFICPTDSASIFGTLTNAPGIYEMTFIAANGCDSTHTITLDWYAQPEIEALTSTDVSCYNGADGSATVVVTNGTSPYNYNWNTNDTEPSITDQAAGLYFITITDANACFVFDSIIINQAEELLINTSSQNVGCEEPGYATAMAIGGIAPYSYVWNTGDTISEILDILAGSYIVTATDANNCTSEEEVIITGAFGPEISIQIDAMPIQDNPTNGSLSVNISGGTPPFEFNWSNGDTTSTVSNLSTGQYDVTITDANGCEDQATTYLFLPGCINGIIWEDENRDACQSAGELNLEGYTLELEGTDIWGNTISQTTTTSNGGYLFEGLPPGQYQLHLIVLDDLILSLPNNCTNDQSDSDFDPTTMTYDFTLSDGECKNDVDGGLYDPCLNVLTPGSICCDQTICGPGNMPDPILEASPATGAGGPLEYMWLKGVPMGPSGSIIYLPIPNSNSPNYAPGALYETTYFARCVRAIGCERWLETSIVKITVDEVAVASISAPFNTCVGEIATFSTPDMGSGATYSWDFGILATPSQASTPSVDVVWSQKGYMTVNLTVSSQGCTSNDSRLMVVTDLPMFCAPPLPSPNEELNQSASHSPQEFFLFPNPVDNQLNIRWNRANENPIIFSIYSLDGVKLIEAISPENIFDYQMTTSDLPAGMYILNIQEKGHESHNLKIIKQ